MLVLETRRRRRRRRSSSPSYTPRDPQALRQRRTSSPPRQVVRPRYAARKPSRSCNLNYLGRLDVACSNSDTAPRSRQRLYLEASHHTCAPAIHLLVSSDRSADDSRRKRSFGHSRFEKCGPSQLTSTRNSGGQAKKKPSREMVGRKYRRLDSLDGGLSGTSCLERNQVATMHEELDGNGHCTDELGKDTTPKKSADLHYELPSKRVKLNGIEDCTDDWTEEHLEEPRKIDKRKSLDELQLTGAPVQVSWIKKDKRKSRVRIQTANNTEHCEVLNVPQEETERSISIQALPNFDVTRAKGLAHEQAIGCASMDTSLGLILQADVVNLHLSTDTSSKDCEDLHRTSKEGSDGRQLLQTTPTVVERDKPQVGSFGSANRLSLRSSHDELKLNSNKEAAGDLQKGLGNDFSNVCVDKNNVGTCDGNDFTCSKDESPIRTDECKVRLKLDEGRRCGLCGGGSNGEPPNYLLPDKVILKGEQMGGEHETAFPGYSEWDAFGNEPGWLGPLLGPLNDRCGIAGVWVHQECAIWTPEVYFAGVGHIKNLRAALRRGRLLKCSRCTRPGATIGCRIERCPRTYHLPCARFEGCFFDHKKFLVACDEHLHLFLPRLPGHRLRRNSLNLERIRFKRDISEWKKRAQRSAQLDLEAEEKWQEKAGVDEEFLRRERKRLHRDLAKVAPVIVGGRGGQQNAEGWECIAGLEDVVKCLKEMVILPLLYPEAFDSLGVSPPRGVLLHGHPGTGKTLAVKALVGACAKSHKKIAYFARKGADCLGKYVGDAERQLRLLFFLAEKHQPSIIFFDEIDGLAPARSQHNDQTQKSVVSTLLALIDGIKSRGSVVVIGATNRPDTLDPALRRPGRFDREVYFPLPSIADRSAILGLLTKKWQPTPTDDAISVLASYTRGFAGADLQALCAQAAMNSLKRTLPINDLLLEAEGKGANLLLPPLPELRVDLIDWATALEQVSPPCSWRSGKSLISRVTCPPVPHHFLPALLWPLVEIILSLHLDPRVTLPPMLEQAAASMKVTLESHIGGPLIPYVRKLSKESYDQRLEEDLESLFCKSGMVAGHKAQHGLAKSYKGSKFRVMISGEEKNGASHLAGCILHGFEGILEMFNISLATMLHEGGGDAIQGIVQILGNIRGKCPCVVYMPKIETWAFKPMDENSVSEKRESSECWSIFSQQVELLPVDLHVAFLAVCEHQKEEIPGDITNFFSGMQPSLMECCSISSYDLHQTLGGAHTDAKEWNLCTRAVPCCWVDLCLTPNMEAIFKRAADEYAEALAEKFLQYVKSCSQPSSISDSSRCFEASTSGGSRIHACILEKGDSQELGYCKEMNSGEQDMNLENPQTTVMFSQDLSKVRGSLSIRPEGGLNEPLSHEQKLMSILGYQLLYQPQFRELRHATSKLREGPTFVTKSPGKRVTHTSDGNNSQSDQGDSVVLKGLVAVGLLAYSGRFLKPLEVAQGVCEVLECLTSRIHTKVNLGKKLRHYSHLLQQAASLEDKVLAWAHDMKRFGTSKGSSPRTVREHAAHGVGCFSSLEKKPEETVLRQGPCSDTKMEAREERLFPTIADSVHASFMQSHENDGERSINADESDKLHQVSPMGPDSSDQNVQHMGRAQDEAELLDDVVRSGAEYKCCAECLQLLKNILCELLIKGWRQRQSIISLAVAGEVIGARLAAVSVTLHGVLEMAGIEGHALDAALDDQSHCECRAGQRLETDNGLFADTVGEKSSIQRKMGAPSTAKFFSLFEITQAIAKLS